MPQIFFSRSPNYGLTNRAFGGNIYRQSTRLWKTNMGVFPSGQWGQTVNLLLSASVVRIHPRPPRTPVSEPGTGVSVLSVLQKGKQGWIRTASTRRTVRRGKSPCATATTAACGRNREELLGLRPAGCALNPRPPRTPVSDPNCNAESENLIFLPAKRSRIFRN